MATAGTEKNGPVEDLLQKESPGQHTKYKKQLEAIQMEDELRLQKQLIIEIER